MTTIDYLSQVKAQVIATKSNINLFNSLISQMGGLMGLCMGFSLLSFIEIVYWVTYRLARNARN